MHDNIFISSPSGRKDASKVLLLESTSDMKMGECKWKCICGVVYEKDECALNRAVLATCMVGRALVQDVCDV